MGSPGGANEDRTVLPLCFPAALTALDATIVERAMPFWLQVTLFFTTPVVMMAYLIKFGFSHIYDIRVEETGLTIVLFTRLRVGTIRFSSIDLAFTGTSFLRKHSLFVSLFCVFPLANRISVNPIVIQLHRKFPKYISITPKSRATFLEQLRILGNVPTCEAIK